MERKLLNIEAFLEVAAAGSFSKAAQKLGTSKSVISRRVSELEDALDTQLIRRTTRRMSLTEEGEIYAQKVGAITEMVDDAHLWLQSKREEPSGTLKIVLPSYLGSSFFTNVLIAQYVRECPLVEVDVRLSDRGPFSYPDEFDLAFITRPKDRQLPDSSYRQVYLGKLKSGLFAAPEYIEKVGCPKDLSELKEHRCLSYLSSTWRFQNPKGEDRIMEIEPQVRTGSNEVLRAVTKAGLGIAYSFREVFEDDLQSGLVLPILSEHTAHSGLDLNLLLPSSRHPPLRVRRFAELIKTHFSKQTP